MSGVETEAPRGGSGAMFDAIAERYDLLNRILSLGVDQAWRRRTVRALAIRSGATVLDLATGTGDLALEIATTHADAHVIGIDPSLGMLAVARRKTGEVGLADRVTWREGDAQAIGLEDASVDAVSMAFGIRNVPDRELALREMTRVTKPGGRVAILELAEPRRGFFGGIARAYIREIVPRIGAAISGAREYRYLQRSIAAFPAAAEFAAMMTDAGLVDVSATSLTFGVSFLYVGVVRGEAEGGSRAR